MINLEDLKQKNIEWETIPEGEIDKELLKKQIESNGSLNDFNMERLYKRCMPSFSTLLSYVNEYPLGKQVTLCYKQGEKIMPFCDFLLANTEEELKKLNQLHSFDEHMKFKFRNFFPYLSNMVHSDYQIKGIKASNIKNLEEGVDIVKCDLRCSIEYKELGKDHVLDYWENEISNLINEENIKDLQKKLFILKQDLYGSTNSKKLEWDDYGLVFVNISNALMMINNQYNKRKEMKHYANIQFPQNLKGEAYLEDIEEHIFTDYQNLASLIAQRDMPMINIQLQNISARLLN